MISTPDRRKAIELIDEAHANGARLKAGCEMLGISPRTYRRWQCEGEMPCDGRRTAVRPKPAHALSEAEEQAVIDLCNRPAYQDLPPAQIVAQEADIDRYWASESTLYRVLRKHKQAQSRGRGRKGATPPPPTSHRADGPNQVWSWDTTWLPGPVVGLFFYLTLIIDLYSRKVVGWEVEARESSALAARVLEQALLKEQCFNQPLVLHADNGSPFKGATLRARLTALNIEPSYSRPRVSNDNPFSESIFATCKAMPAYPANGFERLEDAGSGSSTSCSVTTTSTGTAASNTSRRWSGITARIRLSWPGASRSTPRRRLGTRVAGAGKPETGVLSGRSISTRRRSPRTQAWPEWPETLRRQLC